MAASGQDRFFREWRSGSEHNPRHSSGHSFNIEWKLFCKLFFLPELCSELCPELCRFLPLARTENALHKAAELCSNDLALLAFLRVSGAIFAAAIAG